MPVLLAHQAVTHPATVKSDAVSVANIRRVRIELFHAIVEAEANTNPQTLHIQTNMLGADVEDWVTVVPIKVSNATPATEALTATEPVGETELAVTSSSGFAAEDIVYIQNATLANSEWQLVQELATTPTRIILVDGLEFEQSATSTLWGSAQRFSVEINTEGIAEFRAVYMSEGGTAANTHFKVHYQLLS